MATFAVVPSLPVHEVAPGQVLLTHKFVEGMTRYADLWDGPVVAVMRPHADASTGNLDDAVFDLDDLTFEVRCVEFEPGSLHSALADADAVMLGGDHRLTGLTDWCKQNDKKVVFATEYSLQTRRQIIAAEVSNPLIRWRRYFWEWGQELRNQHDVRAADAVQCNGTPTFDIYRELNNNILLYLDSRITVDMLAGQDSADARANRLRAAGPLRLAYSGRLTPMKGADDLVEVARHLRALQVPFLLDVYGDGDLRPAMTQRIADLGLDDCVTMHGTIDYATELLPTITQNIDLFVCCHRQGDPSCTYLETFACGVPIAGYANEALSGLTRDNPVGWTTPLNQPEMLAQKIAALHARRQRLLDAGNAALELARKHTFEAEFAARIGQIQNLIRPSQPPESPPLDLPVTELAAERLRGVAYRRRAAKLRARAMTRTFPDNAAERLLLITQPERIPQSQIFPFHFFADEIATTYGAAVREADLGEALGDKPALPGDATVIAFQTPYDVNDEDLERLLHVMRESSPEARFVYLDWSAPADLRNAERLNPHIDLYIKKHALRDRNEYGKTTLGDTNLADHYARRLGVDEQEFCFPIPAGFLSKLMVGPSFTTAPMLLPPLMQPFNPGAARPVDLHARFAVAGTAWYQAMRIEAEAALGRCNDLQIAAGNALPLYHFIAELRHSKVCFSPFGYGEVCWRDFEAVMAGAVLLKPEMSHIETHPDIFRPWETYAPVRWDLADLNDTLRKLLADDTLRLTIAENAHGVLHDYLQNGGFVEQIGPVFSGPTAHAPLQQAADSRQD